MVYMLSNSLKAQQHCYGDDEAVHHAEKHSASFPSALHGCCMALVPVLVTLIPAGSNGVHLAWIQQLRDQHQPAVQQARASQWRAGRKDE
jgi:hypothetical protein